MHGLVSDWFWSSVMPLQSAICCGCHEERVSRGIFIIVVIITINIIIIIIIRWHFTCATRMRTVRTTDFHVELTVVKEWMNTFLQPIGDVYIRWCSASTSTRGGSPRWWWCSASTSTTTVAHGGLHAPCRLNPATQCRSRRGTCCYCSSSTGMSDFRTREM